MYIDFFPYADSPNAMWTGYFTSRPLFKRYERKMSHFLQYARQLEVLSNKDANQTQTLWEAHSVAQHHDSVSGTTYKEQIYINIKIVSHSCAKTSPITCVKLRE